jgi:hypothetical protein
MWLRNVVKLEKYKTKLFRIRVHNINTQFIKTVYFESNLIHLQKCFARYKIKHCWRWIWFRFKIYSFNKLCVNIMHSLFGITFVLFLLKLSAGKGFLKNIVFQSLQILYIFVLGLRAEIVTIFGSKMIYYR